LTNFASLERKLTKQRYAKRNRLTRNGRRVRLFIETPLGRAVADDFLKPLASFLAGEFGDKPTPPPGDLGQLVYHPKLRLEDLAIAVLSPLLDCIYRGWEGRDTRSAEMLLRLKIGRNLHDRFALMKLHTAHPKTRQKHIEPQDEHAAAIAEAKKHPWKFVEPDWTPRQCVKAGAWVLEQALALPCFTEVTPEQPFPKISPEWQEKIDQAREDLLRRDQVYLPHTNTPPDWVGYKTEYVDRVQATFVRNSHHRTAESIAAAFGSGDFEHAKGVSALQRVPLRINEQMLSVVENLAVEVMGHSGKKHDNDELLVADDLRIANLFSSGPFYLTYNCDFRGRLNPIPHFNYARADHVRSLFKFANGEQLGTDGLSWLAIHCANCEGSTDKKPWSDRIEWTNEHRRDIQKIASDPLGTLDLWKGADSPFQYVAACLELTAAWADPTNFVTHLPVGFDGSCNGIQHLALMCCDLAAGEMVNLTDTDRPQDVYSHVAARVNTAVRVDEPGEWAQWWRDYFESIDERQIRKLVKQPVMTFAYNVTVPGMTRQVADAYFEISKKQLDFAAARYLATQIRAAAESLLPGPAKVMRYVCDLAANRAAQKLPLKWKSPTGFPVCNLYQKPRLKRLRIGPREFTVADGYLPGIDKEGAVDASAPNFVHSFDASHLVRTVNAATDEGITDIVTVHDSFACLAPHAKRFGKIIRTQLALIYACQNHLLGLCDQNAGDPIGMPLPPLGKLDPLWVQDAEYLFS
jgi:hypothetical protein